MRWWEKLEAVLLALLVALSSLMAVIGAIRWLTG